MKWFNDMDDDAKVISVIMLCVFGFFTVTMICSTVVSVWGNK